MPMTKARVSPVLALLGLLGPGLHATPLPDVPLPPVDATLRVDPTTFDLTAIQGAYRNVLSRWAAGTRAQALVDLGRLEEGVVGQDGTGLERLFKAEGQIVRELEARDPESLLPVLVLHHDSYAAYRDRNNPFLSTHARRLTLALAELYAERGAGQGAKVSTARVLVSLGSYLQEASLMALSARLYGRAVEFDPDNEVALLGLGALFEKSGKYEAALKYLEHLVEAHPGQHEGRLRLGITLARMGRTADAERQLERLTAADPPGWVLNIGYQELAKLYAEKGSDAKAAELLRRAVKRFPDDARLQVQLAAVLERSGEPRAALEAAERVYSLRPAPGPGGSAGESPRYRYSRWSPDALVALRTSLRETSDARLGVLTQALTSSIPRGEG
jgi:tetratricopeptide (TPR) repeat protein